MRTYLFLFAVLTASCGQSPQQDVIVNNVVKSKITYGRISDIDPPKGYRRMEVDSNSFTTWLRSLPLKKTKEVYLYNGTLKKNQSAQFAVLDIPRSSTDLQQCADVVMRLRAEYLYSQKRYNEIHFMDYNGKWYDYSNADNRISFEQYLEKVFGCCGSASLEKQLKPVPRFEDIKPGDVLIKGGFPGHAMIVVDVAINGQGKKAYMLVQGYQPAQDIHLVNNPGNSTLNPWYEIDTANAIVTPEWSFQKKQLKTW